MRIHPLLSATLATVALAACSAAVTPQSFDIEETGTLVRNQAGLTPGMWYLRYNAEGMPGIAEQLTFDEDTVCITGETRGACERSVFESDLSVTIRAMEQGDVWLVKEMELR